MNQMKHYELPELLYHQLLEFLGGDLSKNTGVLYALVKQTKDKGFVEDNYCAECKEKTPIAKTSE